MQLSVRAAQAATTSAWLPGPPCPHVTFGELHVWRADLQRVGDEVLTSLSEAERHRQACFPRPRDGLHWARSRGVLRALLARYTAIDPRALELGVDGSGKPRVTVPESSEAISFNLSHSGPLALYVFTHANPVGVDVQVPITRSINVAAISQRVFGVAEGRRLAKLEPARRATEFCRAWVRLEAAAKCLGTGLGSSSNPGRNRPPSDAPEVGLFVTELDLGGSAAAAVAARARPHRIVCWDWRASSPSKPSPPRLGCPAEADPDSPRRVRAGAETDARTG